jgi:hypothetical protein
MKLIKTGFVALVAALSLGGTAEAAFVTVGTNSENRIQTDTRWTRDNVYILARCIIVDNGATLTIEPGTIVRAVTSNMSGFASEPGALLVARGGKLIANGTADDPIIFTSIDDTNVPGGINTVPATFTSVGAGFTTSMLATRPTTVTTAGVFTVATAAKRPAVNDTLTFSAVSGITGATPLATATTYTVATTPSATTFTLTGRTGVTAGTCRIDTINSTTLTEAVTDDTLSTSIKLTNGAAYKVTGATLPGGLVAGTTYYVKNSANVFAGASLLQLSTTSGATGGTIINITSAGSADVSLVPDTNTLIVTGASRDPSLFANNYAATGDEGDNGFCKANLWGGVMICGNAYVGQSTTSDGAATVFTNSDALPTYSAVIDATAQNNGKGTDFVEGLSTASGSSLLNPTSAIYGGLNDADNSGVIRFCSMRYGGFVVGAAATGNEINGLTVCGAGTGTTLEFIEIFQNRDDGFEWFGGKHNTRFLFSVANQDDSFDADEGFRGTHQFWLAAQGTISQTTGSTGPLRSGFASNNTYVGQLETATDYQYDKLLEVDGPESADQNRLPRTNMTILNATLLAGQSLKNGVQPRDEAIVSLHNAVIEGATRVNQQELGAEGEGFMTEWRISNIHANNPSSTVATWVPGTSEANFVNAYNGLTTAYPLSASTAVGAAALRLTAATLSNVYTDHGTTASNSQIGSNWNNAAHLTGGSATSDLYTYQGFDPRTTGSGAATEDGTFPTPSGFVDADYAGMSLNNNFLSGWSTLEWLTVLPATNTARPYLTIGVSTNNPTVSFATAGATVKYVIEKSTDGKNWTVLTTTPVTGASTVSYTDTSTTLAAGSTVQYRAYAL